MPNPFLSHIEKKIQENYLLINDMSNDVSGLRIRVFDDFKPHIFGPEAQKFINQAEQFYAQDLFKPPFTKNNVDKTHEMMLRFNEDLEGAEWNAFWDKMQDRYSIHPDNIALLKFQFLAAYRFRTLSQFSFELQKANPSQAAAIVATESKFLKTLDNLIRNDSTLKYATKDELLKNVNISYREDLNNFLNKTNSFAEFYAPKIAELISNLNEDSFKMVFEHYNQTNKPLTSVNLTALREFCVHLEKSSKENSLLKEYLKSDPIAFAFLQKTVDTLKQAQAPEDASILKNLENELKNSEANPENIVRKLKELEKKVEKGEFKELLLKSINEIQKSSSYPRVAYATMQTQLSQLKQAAALEAMHSENPSIRAINDICDIYKKKGVTSAPTFSYSLSPPSPRQPPILHASKHAATSAVPIAPAPAQPKSVHFGASISSIISQPEVMSKEQLAEQIESIASQLMTNGARDAAYLMHTVAEQIIGVEDSDEVKEVIDRMKAEVRLASMPENQTPNEARAIAESLEKLDKIYEKFQKSVSPTAPKLR